MAMKWFDRWFLRGMGFGSLETGYSSDFCTIDLSWDITWPMAYIDEEEVVLVPGGMMRHTPDGYVFYAWPQSARLLENYD